MNFAFFTFQIRLVTSQSFLFLFKLLHMSVYAAFSLLYPQNFQVLNTLTEELDIKRTNCGLKLKPSSLFIRSASQIF